MLILLDLTSVKLNNKSIIISLLLITAISMSSCKKEDVDVVSNQYSFSFVQNYTLSDNQYLSYNLEESNFSTSVATSNNLYLSYGVLFNLDDVKINQIKISNDLYNWTVSPDKIVLNGASYYGKRSLLIPNKDMLEDGYECEIFLNNGSVLVDKIETNEDEIMPLKEKLSIYDNYMLLEDEDNSQLKLQKKNMLESINNGSDDRLKSINIDDMKNDGDANYDIRLYKGDEVLLDRELNLDLENNIAMFTSSYIKNCDTILLIKRIDNTTVSCNKYSVVRD